MPMNRIAGAVLVAVGIVLLIFAYNASNAPLEQISETITGRFTDQTMWFLIIGVAGIIGGGLLLAIGNRR